MDESPKLAEEFPPFDPPELDEPDVPVVAAEIGAPSDAGRADAGEPKEDPWAEPDAPVSPEPKRTGLVVPGMMIAATAVIAFLGIQNHSLQAKVERLTSAAVPPSPPAPAALKIISAIYGSGSSFADVTDRVNELLSKPDSEFNARPDWLHADPLPHWNKQLLIIYEWHGQRRMFSAGEGGRVSLAALQAGK